jgi:hypothetical protein
MGSISCEDCWDGTCTLSSHIVSDPIVHLTLTREELEMIIVLIQNEIVFYGGKKKDFLPLLRKFDNEIHS